MDINAIDTVKEWIRDGELTVSPRMAALVLKCKPYSLNLAAQQGTLTLNHTFVGNRLRISTHAILNFLEGRGTQYVGKHEKESVDIWRDNRLPSSVIDGYPRKALQAPQAALWLR